ncbi:AAA family ATPase [Yaniella flava]|uniref:AAA family ATPase n=1 Tax=Yaniella flava TaxID=287930 RepID=UPI003CD090B8
MQQFNTLPVRRLEEDPRAPLERSTWPATLASVQQILDHGLDLGSITIFVGDNGTGKSTIVEALARRFWFEPRGWDSFCRALHSANGVRPRQASTTGAWVGSVETGCVPSGRNHARTL